MKILPTHLEARLAAFDAEMKEIEVVPAKGEYPHIVIPRFQLTEDHAHESLFRTQIRQRWVPSSASSSLAASYRLSLLALRWCLFRKPEACVFPRICSGIQYLIWWAYKKITPAEEPCK
jgi:hypothetical protein